MRGRLLSTLVPVDPATFSEVSHHIFAPAMNLEARKKYFCLWNVLRVDLELKSTRPIDEKMGCLWRYVVLLCGRCVWR